MTLAFYKVDNHPKVGGTSYDRHFFDRYYGQNETIRTFLNLLPDDEVRMYDLSSTSTNYGPTIADFIEDYNDEILDGGWWSVLITD